jgi:Na+/melibiose symporter-like transporter
LSLWRSNRSAPPVNDIESAEGEKVETIRPGTSWTGRDFGWYWFGQSISVVGDQIAAFVLPTIAITMFSASEIQVGVLNAISTGAYTVLGLFVGALMDRIRRRPVMVTADLVRAVTFCMIPAMAMTGRLSMGLLYVVALVSGVLAVVFNVASQSHLPTLVDSPLLGIANSRMELSNTLSLFAGPTLGGLLIQWWGGPWTLGINGVSFLFSVAGIALLRSTEPPPARRTAASSIGGDIREGVAALWQHAVLRRTTIASALRNFGNAAVNTVLLLFAYRGLHLSTSVAGVLFASGSVAAVIGAWATPRLGRGLTTGRTLLLANSAAGAWIATPLALVLPTIPVLLAMRIVSSFSLPLWNSTIATVRQSLTPVHLLGRLNATAGTLNFCAIPLGTLLGGAAAQLSSTLVGPGPGLALTLSGAGLAAASGTALLAHDQIRRLGHTATLGR